jgi:hypothetical protein
MTQRIFDIGNEEDMKLLWSILPDFITSVYQKKESVTSISNWVQRDDGVAYPLNFISLRWHDKTEITRPVNYESMIGCVGWFWDNDDEEKSLGVLTEYNPETGFPFVKGNNDNTYSNFRPAKKSELKFWGED